MSSGWAEVLSEHLDSSQKEAELEEEAEACRSSSPEGVDVAVPLSPQSSDVWWVQCIKGATKHLHPPNAMLEVPVSVLSNCTGACSEAAALKARVIIFCFFANVLMFDTSKLQIYLTSITSLMILGMTGGSWNQL